MSGDYSRKTFKPHHNYSGVLMQQGRVQLDADWNEQVEIGLRRQRAETVDTIGRTVVPMETPDGFRVELNAGELSIFPGRMYVDGLLAENHGAGPHEFYPVLEEERGTNPVLYQDQPYFPNAMEIESLPTSGIHIAYLDVWQRELTYVKQPNLVEPAVGVDTTARWQTVWQVKVLQLDPQSNDIECGDQNNQWDDMVAPSAGRLTTSIVEPQEDDDVCLVPTEGGYRALENRLYRVEVHEGGLVGDASFKWARHNASVESSVLEISGTELIVVQSQWDGDRRFEIDDWVEVTDDVREFSLEPGEMRRVVDVDYASNTITLDNALPPVDFPVLVTGATLPERHTRIKRWDQSNEVDPSSGVITISSDPFYLEAGIQIEFDIDGAASLSGEFHVGDYWLFSARSADASIELLNEAPPRGIHHHYARLAVLNFPDDQDDCRPHWPPEFGGNCCTVTVGDGEASHGHFTSIEAAINNLPEQGGKVCVLPGVYEEHIEILGRQNVTVSGCGDRTRVIAPMESSSIDQPVFRIVSGNGIRIESLAIEANQQGEGVLIDEAISNHNISLSELSIVAGTGSAIRCDSGNHISILNSRITMRDQISDWPGVFVIADDVEILNNLIETEASASSLTGEFAAAVSPLANSGRGGIQIGGTSERVNIAGNTIRRGRGDGITLGSLSLVDDNQVVVRSVVASIRVPNDDCEPCSPPRVDIPPRFEIDDGGNPVPDPPVVISAGALYDISIADNLIENMGRNGIGVIGFFDLDESDDFISVENLEIAHNRIERCLRSPLQAVEAELEDDIGYGGIALADTQNLIVHHNRILDNGSNPFDPICGIYVLHGEGVEICDNRILNNGEKFNDDTGDERRGARSGIHLVYAIAPTEPLFPEQGDQGFPRQNGVPAAKIHNNIVSHPVGRALTINAIGPVAVSDNQLTSRGILQGQASAIASTVAILNLGTSNELYQQLNGFSQMTNGRSGLASMSAGVGTVNETSINMVSADREGFRLGRFLANGNVLFVNNQVVLDELDVKQNAALSAVAIFSLDDVTYNDNQCDYSLWGDFLIFPNFIFAPSVRASNNRFKESFPGALLSAVTIGFMNTTTDNQSTHCLVAIGLPGMKVFKDNIELWDAILGNLTDVLACSFITESIVGAFNFGEG